MNSLLEFLLLNVQCALLVCFYEPVVIKCVARNHLLLRNTLSTGNQEKDISLVSWLHYHYLWMYLRWSGLNLDQGLKHQKTFHHVLRRTTTCHVALHPHILLRGCGLLWVIWKRTEFHFQENWEELLIHSREDYFNFYLIRVFPAEHFPIYWMETWFMKDSSIMNELT